MDNKTKNINEEALIQQCINGEILAQKNLYNRYAKAMYHSIIRMVGKKDEAQDILQDSFIKVFKELKNFKSRSSLGAWIKKICVNTTLTQMKKNKRIQFTDLDEGSVLIVEEEKELELDVNLIHHCIKNLPEGCRVVLNLYLFEGFRHSEIAEILEVTESTSKSQYIRGKKLLRKALKSIMYEQR